ADTDETVRLRPTATAIAIENPCLARSDMCEPPSVVRLHWEAVGPATSCMKAPDVEWSPLVPPKGGRRQGNRCELAVGVNCETGEIGESSEASQTANEARASAPLAAVIMLPPVAWARVADLVAQAAHAGA